MHGEKMIRPYGLWPSPVTPSGMAARPRLEDVQWLADGSGLVWLERRDGIGQLLLMRSGEPPRTLLTDHNVSGGVGYGGGDFGLGRESVYFADRSGGLFRYDLPSGQPVPITLASGGSASPMTSPSGRWVLYIRSDGSEDVLAIADARGSQWSENLVSGADFYMQPAWNPSEDAIAWIEWNHPNMPWDSTCLKLGVLAGDPPHVVSSRIIVGDPGETASQPQFSPDGRFLSYILSRGEWEALEVLELATGSRKTWLEGDFALSTPAWTQGNRSYGWNANSQSLYIIKNAAGRGEVCSVDSSGNCLPIPMGRYTWFKQISVSPTNSEFAVIAASPADPEQIVRWDGERIHVLAISDSQVLPETDLPVPLPVEWETTDGLTAFGFLSLPANSLYSGQGLPPLIVNVHGGPTSQVPLSYPSDALYFTTRGYAWLEVNYRGSTGYGRKYRDSLSGRWGEADVEDCVTGAQAMAARGLVDKSRMVIFGGSSGGLTVLNALIYHPGVFKAGVAMYPVCDLFTLALETHKFEKHYDQQLVGVLPADAEVYRKRSPLFQADRIRDAVAIFHGSDDRAVPLSQSQAVVDRLRAAGTSYIFQIYEGEGHGFRKTETLLDLYPRIEKFLQNFVITPGTQS